MQAMQRFNQHTSLRSSAFGMSHNKDLSRRPGRSNAESMRSGRLLSRTILIAAFITQKPWSCTPCCSEHIDTVEALSTIHLSQQLVDHAICNSRTIVSSEDMKLSILRVFCFIIRHPTFWVQLNRTHQKITHKAWQRWLVQISRVPDHIT